MVFRTLPEVVIQGQSDGEINVFKKALMRLEIRLKLPPSIALNRFKFYTRTQQYEETFDEFLTVLRGLYMHCNFGDMTDEMIRDQIIVHVKSRKIQEQLWVMGDPKLHDVITTAKVLEQSEKLIKSIHDSDGIKCMESDVVGAMGSSGISSNHNSNFRNKMFSKKWDRSDRMERASCYRCGNINHIATSPQCPAVGKRCQKCGKIRHFALVCKDLFFLNNSETKGKVAYMNSGKCEEGQHREDVEHRGVVSSLKNGDGMVESSISQPRCEIQMMGKI
ncbi:hypothetical protein NDU88_003759 [Pleurodeles waltl]|uniref:CCHC-type domain-containing protein n=1 Tax=Pleurodeles waltl TaxID=8319 RepID=A0AAV7MRM5_PLEWA|nr:hypothetical protein NDU88_003759 [Pleurodeles waltl]